MKSYIDLIRLKTAKMLDPDNLNFVLNDDVWERDTLIVKSGGYLTNELINKLINFGIKEVSIDFPEAYEFAQTQNIAIIDNSLVTAAWLVKNLKKLGFDKENVSMTSNYNSINNLFRNQKINFVFINSSLYEKCQKCIDKYSLLRNTHVFVVMDKGDSVRKLRNSYTSDVKFLFNPLNAKVFSIYVNRALNTNLLDYYMDSIRAS